MNYSSNKTNLPQTNKKSEIIKVDKVNEKERHLESYAGVFREIQQNIRLGNHGIKTTVNRPIIPDKSDDRLFFARQAQEYTEQLSPHDPRKIYGSILAVLPSFMKAKTELEQDRNDYRKNFRLTESGYDHAIDQTIKFNDVIRDIIDQFHNKIRPADLLGIIKTAAVSYRYSSEDRQRLLIEAGGVIKGMQHELAFESVLYYLPDGFEVLDRNESSRDDANGKDYRVRCPNGSVVSVDVKASHKSEEKAREKRNEYFASKGLIGPKNELILFSGFDQEDFETSDPWRPKHEAILRELPKIEEILLWASSDTSNKILV